MDHAALGTRNELAVSTGRGFVRAKRDSMRDPRKTNAPRFEGKWRSGTKQWMAECKEEYAWYVLA